jgi:YihY family inner membrane protein
MGTLMHDGSVMDEVRAKGGVGAFLRDVIHRFREADGTSHGRALAYQGTFALVSGFIGLVGLASVLGIRQIRDAVIELSKQVAPGPSGQILREAAQQATGGGTAMILGLGAALVATTLAMAQMERSANRIAGRSDDRPEGRRYLVAFGLALSVGLLGALGLLIMGGGGAVATGFGWKGTASDIWTVLRWPLGIALVAGAIYLLYRAAPERPLGSPAETAAGTIVAAILWVIFTAALAIYFSSGSASQTYGQLLSFIALLLWAGATSFALHLGLAVTAELGSRTQPEGRVSVPESPVVERARP